jgi:hydroxymethylbilane synthase
MNTTTVRIGSRGSQLALWQAHWVRDELQKTLKQVQIEIEIIKTKGDRILDSPLSMIGDKGLFTKEIEAALMDRRIDLAVHSLKDLPTLLPEGLAIGAITKREDVRDVFISHPGKNHRRFEDLPKGSRIATGSLRRTAQLLSWRPDIEIIDLRGNLNTRFAKLDASEWDGMILARAGVVRLGMESRISEVLPIERMLPAVGQGALAIEIRENDKAVSQIIKPLSSSPTTIAATAERALLRYLEGGCQVPIGAYARIENGTLMIDGMIGGLDGRTIVRGRVHGSPDEAGTLGEQLARTLFESGGKEILERIRTPQVNEVPGV